MSERLPVPWNRERVQPAARQLQRRAGLARRWLGSPLAEALADAAPDLLRFAGRAVQGRSGSRASRVAPGLPPSGANGMTVSEVEIDLASPLIRRVVVRTTSAWSIAPEVALANERRGRGSRGSRLGIGAVSLAGLALLGYAAARRAPLPLPWPARMRGPLSRLPVRTRDGT